MSLLETIEKDYLVAYKAKNAVTLGVLRLLKTAIKNFQVEHMRAPEDGDVFDVIIKQGKQRQDSIEQFTKAGRPDLAEKEAAELEVLRAYLPTPLEGEELTAAIATAVAASGATGMRDMGKVMQCLMAEHKGRLDGKAASDAVKQALQKIQ